MSRKLNKRRDFLKRSAHMALLGATGSAVGGKMSLIGSALAAQGDYANLQDYKALVCVFHFGGRDDIGKGRLVPEMSVNQYGAAMGSWLGLSDSDLLEVFPDLDRFESGWKNQYGLFS